VGGDELADAITYVLWIAKYENIVSDLALIMDSLVLTNFLDNNGIFLDSYLVQLIHGICVQFKNIADFMKTTSSSI